MPDELTAGPATDALVAEAMGKCVSRPDWSKVAIWQDQFGYITEVPAYSATGDGMLAAMRWMMAQGWWCSLTSPDETLGERRWSCVAGLGLDIVNEPADTAPLAVARALLAAVAATEEPT